MYTLVIYMLRKYIILPYLDHGRLLWTREYNWETGCGLKQPTITIKIGLSSAISNMAAIF